MILSQQQSKNYFGKYHLSQGRQTSSLISHEKTLLGDCWWSLWMLFVLFEFAWKREVSAIINPAKIGMTLRLPELPESNQMVKGTFQDRFISILYITASIPTHEIPGFAWKLKIWRYKRFDWRSWTHTTCSLIPIWFPFPFITWESTIHFLDSQNSS